MSNVRIDRGQFLQLADWMRQHVGEISDQKLTYLQVAKQASRELGFPLSVSSIKDLVGYLGLTWERPEGKQSGMALLSAGLRELRLDSENKLRGLEAEVAVLRRLVGHLYSQLNEKPPIGITIPSNWQPISVVNRS